MVKQSPSSVMGNAPHTNPSANELVIKIKAIVLNPADVGTQKLEVLIDGYPEILGCDATEEIVEVHLTLAELYTPSDLVICATGPLNRKDSK
ncbi:hypothetical protein BDV37DRAFT_251546 [Aspergillus pseudonomiae]|uniref:Uncharacterized protein n=1 Tax=Aspergillus pseudonomiae TaxID=1506151 RepID=A0A5N7D8Z5_9EURO|nr:uncharacterized protein BDV37DRAFT_251546 [Aspergillus pseudonomiae]KAE8402922.1 hypothetical protein BDV37DRAFT_251546 [Aspergillus pseudonomiae]